MAECVINMDLFEGSVSLHQIDNLEHLINKHIGYDSSSCPLVGRSVGLSLLPEKAGKLLFQRFFRRPCYLLLL